MPPTPDVFAPISENAGDPDGVYHIVNPGRFNWTKDLLPALKHSKLPPFEAMSLPEWLDRLRNSDSDPSRNPSIKLLEFWEDTYRPLGEPATTRASADHLPEGKVPNNDILFETQRTLAECPGLADASDLMANDYVGRFVDKWLESWTS